MWVNVFMARILVSGVNNLLLEQALAIYDSGDSQKAHEASKVSEGRHATRSKFCHVEISQSDYIPHAETRLKLPLVRSCKIAKVATSFTFLIHYTRLAEGTPFYLTLDLSRLHDTSSDRRLSFTRCLRTSLSVEKADYLVLDLCCAAQTTVKKTLRVLDPVQEMPPERLGSFSYVLQEPYGAPFL